MNKFVAEKAAQSAEVALDYLLENQGGVFHDPESGFKIEGKLTQKSDKSSSYRSFNNQRKNIDTLELLCFNESIEFIFNVLNSRESISKIKNYFNVFKFNDLQIEFSTECFNDYSNREYCNISRLQGLTLTSVFVSKNYSEIYFRTTCGKLFKMFHQQDCCENVTIEDIVGDLEDIIDTPLLLAEDVINNEGANSKEDPDYGTCTYTYYKLSTIKGDVSIRWYGESNGYYSESVDFVEINQEDGESNV
jgi:hypothetical protein